MILPGREYNQEQIKTAKDRYHSFVNLVSKGTVEKSITPYIQAYRLFINQDLIVVEPSNTMIHRKLYHHLTPALQKVFLYKFEGDVIDASGRLLNEKQKKDYLQQITSPLPDGEHTRISSRDTLDTVILRT